MTTVAACACGQLRLDLDEAPERASICHCDACRTRTGSAFSWNTRVPEDLSRPTGEATRFARTGDDGHEVAYHFCPTCGVTVWYTISDMPGRVIPVGALAPARDLPEPGVSVYDDRRPTWLDLPEEMERWV